MKNLKTPEKIKPKIINDFMRVFLVPTLFGKAAILYFGANYSISPGEGYGTGLLVSIAFTLTTVGLFLWKHRDYDDT